MKGKVTISLLAVFLLSAVYLCPCVLASTPEVMVFKRPHACCPEMPGCPAAKDPAKGLKNLLSVSSYEIKPLISFQEVPPFWIAEESHFFEDFGAQAFFDRSSVTHAPPDFYIQYSSLLI